MYTCDVTLTYTLKNRYTTEPAPKGRLFKVSYVYTEPKKYFGDSFRILFGFLTSARNLKGSYSGYRFGNIPNFLECTSLLNKKCVLSTFLQIDKREKK